VSGDEETGMQLEDTDMDLERIESAPEEKLSLDELKRQLDIALANEEYEKASQIRDEINKREGGE
jgi:protein-arginine kinase activator protein McsA